LLGDVFGDQCGIGVYSLDFDDVDADLAVAAELLLQTDAQSFDTGSAATYDNARSGGEYF
jgi:hypothetical protein